MIEAFADYLSQIEDEKARSKTEEVLDWVAQTFPNLTPKFAWNQPMFTDHGTFIIGFSVSKQHLAVAPERAGILRFSEEIAAAGHSQSKMLIRFLWSKPFDYPLLKRIIQFNIEDKADCSNFWRK